MKKWIILLLISISHLVYSQEGAPKIVLSDLNGNLVALDTIYSKGVTIVDFWATWCTPCKEALPHLNELYEKYQKDGLQVVTVSIDGTKSIDKVQPYVIKEGFSFLVLLDPKAEGLKAFGGKNIPHTVVIDREGKIVMTKFGYLPGDEEELEKKIIELLQSESNQ